MPRKYVHTKRGKTIQYQSTALADAVKAVKNGDMSVRQASKAFSVPKSTLGDRVSGKHPLDVQHGRPPALPTEIEDKLVSSIKTAAKMGLGLTRRQIIRRVQILLKRKKISSKFQNFKGGMDWFEGLRRRHPSLALRKPEKLTSVRARMMNEEVVNKYFYDLSAVMAEADLTNEPDVIWNCDESGFNFEHAPVSIIAEKGDRCVLSRTSSKSNNVTVMACVNASGKSMPPMLITKGKTQRCLHAFNVNEAPDGTVWTFQKNGWIDDDIAEQWFQEVFLQNCGPRRPQVLILDGHGSHETLGLIQCAIEENIILISLPPHCTHILQPLDRSIFGPMKTAYNKHCSSFLSDHPLHIVNKWTFPTLLKSAWQDSVTENNIRNGFRACGIYPVNRNAIPASVFNPSKPTNVVMQNAAEPEQTLQASTSSAKQQVEVVPTQPLATQIEDNIHVFDDPENGNVSVDSMETTLPPLDTSIMDISFNSAQEILPQLFEHEVQPVLDISDPDQLISLISGSELVLQNIGHIPDFHDHQNIDTISTVDQATVFKQDTLCVDDIESAFLPPKLQSRSSATGPSKVNKRPPTSHKILTSNDVLLQKKLKEELKIAKENKCKSKRSKLNINA